MLCFLFNPPPPPTATANLTCANPKRCSTSGRGAPNLYLPKGSKKGYGMYLGAQISYTGARASVYWYLDPLGSGFLGEGDYRVWALLSIMYLPYWYLGPLGFQ